MNKDKKNQIIMIFIIITIMIGVCYVIFRIANENKDAKDVEEYDKIEESKSLYYDYYEKGIIKSNIINSAISIPDSYLDEINKNQSIEEIIENITAISTVNIPIELINSYEEDVKTQIEKSASGENIDINEYIKNNYNLNNMDEYIEENETGYAILIRDDIMYQALALKLGINEVTEEDILNYYSIEEDRIQEIMNRYGEKLAYKNALEGKVKTSSQEKIK